MGVVYLGVSTSGRQVAVKLVRGPYAQEEEFRTRFRQEIEAARRVSGAFTAPVVDADPDADRPWMATLYVPGLNPAEVVEKDGPLSRRELRGVYFSNRFGRLLALDSRTGAEVWRTSALDDPGDKVQSYPPRVLLVKDAIVAMAGDTAFSRSPDGPT